MVVTLVSCSTHFSYCATSHSSEGGLTHGAIPRLFSVQVKFLTHNMIRNPILCNDWNANRWPLAYMHVHVQILPRNTHALFPIYKKKPPYLHTSYLNTPSLPAPPEVLTFVRSLCLQVKLKKNLSYKYLWLSLLFSSKVYSVALMLVQD